ncbi:hypothetical protein GPK93_04g06900 [Encephalitozoon intestinalis]|nr:hypothetical protein GPK93_04g06900 [Encephalitozoon intestinalis]
MNSEKYKESVENVELLLKSLESVLEGIRKNNVDQEDIDNIKESLRVIKFNAKACL